METETDIENGKSFTQIFFFFKKSSALTKDKEQTSCIKRIRRQN